LRKPQDGCDGRESLVALAGRGVQLVLRGLYLGLQAGERCGSLGGLLLQGGEILCRPVGLFLQTGEALGASAVDFAVIRSFISTAKKQGWDIIQALTQDPKCPLASLRPA
jgi:hypothetical protein